MRPQLDIYEANLEQIGMSLPEKYRATKKVEDEETRANKLVGNAFADEVKEDIPSREDMLSPFE